MILIGFIVSLISIVSLPIVVYFIGGMEGFIISCLIILFQGTLLLLYKYFLGLANATLLTSIYGIVSFLPGECIFAIATGQGFAGILMNITRYITLFAFSTENNATNEEIKLSRFKESLLFFSFSGFICLLCVFCIIFLFKNQYFLKRFYAFNSEIDEKDLEKAKINTYLLNKNEESVFKIYNFNYNFLI